MNEYKYRFHASDARSLMLRFQDFRFDLEAGSQEVLAGLISGLIATSHLTRGEIVFEACRVTGARRSADIVDVLDRWDRPEERGGLWHCDREGIYRLY